MDFAAGDALGDYEILGLLGSGGMGKVYKVRHRLTQRVEAAKLLLPDLTTDPRSVQRFLREIRITASLDHPNIAALRNAQILGDRLLMTMELVEGSTLKAVMHRGRIPLDQCIEYTLQALAALSCAHAQGIIHRDIKPANIMITSTGGVKVMDFGIARTATDCALTGTGQVIGSPAYMAPEQIACKAMDTRIDIYALGVTFYEMLTGERPFKGAEYQVMNAHLKQNPRPPQELNPSLPPALNGIVLRALAKRPDDRFPTADVFRNAVEGFRTASRQQAIIKEIACRNPIAAPPAPQKDKVDLSFLLLTLAFIAVAVIAIVIILHPALLR